MNRTTLMLASLFMLAGLHVNAQSVAPATSEDTEQFDKQVAQDAESSNAQDPDGDPDKGKALAKGKNKNDKDKDGNGAKDPDKGKALAKGKDHKKKDNFGQKVSAEAHKLKDSDTAKRKEFGKWVSDQRRQDDQSSSGGSSNSGNSGTTHGADDARTAAPVSGAGSASDHRH